MGNCNAYIEEVGVDMDCRPFRCFFNVRDLSMVMHARTPSHLTWFGPNDIQIHGGSSI